MISIPPDVPFVDEFGRSLRVPPEQQMTLPVPAQQPAIPVPVQPVAEMPVPVQQEQQIPHTRQVVMPEYVPIRAEPESPMYHQAQRMGLTPPDREDPAFRNSKLRTVLNAIAGGLAGASAGPQVGMQVGSALHDMKYNRALANFQERAKDLGEKASIESELQKRGEAAANRGVQWASAQATADYKDITAAQNAEKIDIARKLAESKTLRNEALTELTRAQITDPLRKDLLARIINTDDPVEQKRLMDLYKEAKQKPEKSVAQIEEESAARARGSINAYNTPEGRQVISQRAALQAAGSIAGQSTPESLESTKKITEAKTTTATKARELAKLDIAQTEQAREVADAKEANKLTANMRDSAASAEKALTHLPRIKASINKLNLGPIYPRWRDFLAGTYGSDPEFAPLRTGLGLLQTLTAKIHVGARGSVYITQKFQDLMNAKTMDKATLLASLGEVEEWLKEYANLKPPGKPKVSAPGTPSRPPLVIQFEGEEK